MSYPRLLADIGGTNARFALETAPSVVEAISVLPCANYLTLTDALQSYLASSLIQPLGPSQIQRAGIAIANPIHGDIVKMTNHHWTFSINEVKETFHFHTLAVINDFQALAMALPFLSANQTIQVGMGKAESNKAIGLIGPGTGLGVSGLIPTLHGWVALDSEGGHTSFSPTNQEEIALLDYALKQYSHVSSERFLSGAGLKLIYQSLAQHRSDLPDLDAPEIMRRGLALECLLCTKVLKVFCELLGTIAGNLAVTLGAKGGIYIGGGIVPRLGQFFAASNFRQRFEDKGRFAEYTRQIPTFVITDPYPAFIGISALLQQTL